MFFLTARSPRNQRCLSLDCQQNIVIESVKIPQTASTGLAKYPMKYFAICLVSLIVFGCSNTPGESGTLEVVSFSPAEGTKIDCNTTIKYQLKYQISDAQSGGSRTVTAKNNQTTEKNYSVSASGGEISDQISGHDFYTNVLGVKCRNGNVPFSFSFSLKLANGTRIDTKTFLFDEVAGTNCLANTSFC